MIYMEIACLRLMRSRDLIFLKFKRNILSNPKFASILVVMKVLCMVGFCFSGSLPSVISKLKMEFHLSSGIFFLVCRKVSSG